MPALLALPFLLARPAVSAVDLASPWGFFSPATSEQRFRAALAGALGVLGIDAIRERGADAEATQVARWRVASTLRALKLGDEALALQLALADECERAGARRCRPERECAIPNPPRGEPG